MRATVLLLLVGGAQAEWNEKGREIPAFFTALNSGILAAWFTS